MSHCVRPISVERNSSFHSWYRFLYLLSTTSRILPLPDSGEDTPLRLVLERSFFKLVPAISGALRRSGFKLTGWAFRDCKGPKDNSEAISNKKQDVRVALI